jgi:iron complex outermembrane receptor protein
MVASPRYDARGGTASLVLALLASAPAGAQTALPPIVVTAPSPIVRAPAPGPASPTAVPGPPPAAPAPLPGTLPIVTDQFATVTVVPNEELRRDGGGTFGDVLFSKPGVTGSSFAPGASSRPIVRGLDNYRVRIQENGVGANGVSDLAEDHGVPIDPLSTSQLEVVRGPATLRWGSQAIGGVVNATNNRIPDALPCDDAVLRAYASARAPAGSAGPIGRPCARVETRGAFTTVDSGVEGAVLLDAGGRNVAFHADAFGRRGSDYRIPGYPYLFPPDPAPAVHGRQPNSSARADGGSVGASYVFDRGFVGVAVSQFDAFYRIPGIEAAETNTRIDMNQTKVTSKGEYRAPGSAVAAVRYWFGATDYKHNELANEGGFDGVQQTFTNKEQEGRVEVQLTPFDLRFATLTTAAGVQAWHQKLTAPGIEGGLFDPNTTRTVAAFLFNELKFTEAFRMQVAGRIESANVTGSVPNLFVDPTLSIARDLTFTPVSGAVGFLHDLPWGLVASLTGQYVERAPRGPELLSRGVHEATGTFDVGNPNLVIEVARSIEIGLRRALGPFRFEATAYYTRFNGFIFRRLTGETCDEDFASCTPAGAGGELNQAVYTQRDATFRGAEFQAQFDVAPLGAGMWGVEGQYDIVRATFSDGTNVPRIPPQRLGGGLFWRDPNWLVRVNLLHAFAQNNIAAVETPTAGYDLIKAELSYTRKFRNPDGGPRELTAGVVGNNLLDDDIRNSVSFKKDEVLLPGRSVRLFATLKF